MNILLFVATLGFVLLLARNWRRTPFQAAEPQSPQDQEIARARAVGDELEREYERRSKEAVAGNKAAVEKAYRAQQWIEEARLNSVIPRLLDTVQLWPYWIRLPDDRKWEPPEGVTVIGGEQDRKKPWASWHWENQVWRIEAEWRPSLVPDPDAPEIGNYRVFIDDNLMCDMALSADGLRVVGVLALTVGPWVPDLIRFAGKRRLESQALSSASFAKHHQERAAKISF